MPKSVGKQLFEICKFIYHNYKNNTEQILENYLMDELDKTKFGLGDEYEDVDISINIFDGWDRFVKILIDYISLQKRKGQVKIKVNQNKNGEHVIRSTEFGLNINIEKRNKYLEKLDGLMILSSKKKGDIYETFSTKFFEDIGFKCSNTPSSRDEGLDIIGFQQISYSSEITTKFIENVIIKLFVQVKYQDTPADKPVLRHLIGDTLFLQQEEREYKINGNDILVDYAPSILCTVSHKEFTRPAVEFGEKKGLVLFDSDMMISKLISMDIISSALKYLDELSI